MRLAALLLAITVLASVSADAQQKRSFQGRRAEVSLHSPVRAVKGELLAVGADRLWLLADTALLDPRISEVARVRIKRHPFTGSTMLVWGAIGAVTTGIALTAACASLGDDGLGGCGLVLPVFGLSWMVVAGVSSLFTAPSAYKTFRPGQIDDLRAFARFPQGLPEGVDPSQLGPQGFLQPPSGKDR